MYSICKVNEKIKLFYVCVDYNALLKYQCFRIKTTITHPLMVFTYISMKGCSGCLRTPWTWWQLQSYTETSRPNNHTHYT